MCKLHPALKVAKRILKSAGIETFYSGSLSLQACGFPFERPLHVDIVLSAYEDKGKMQICWFYDVQVVSQFEFRRYD